MSTPKRSLGDLTVVELLASAQSELVGLGEHLKLAEAKTNGVERVEGEQLMVGAYIGSIAGRIANAQIKIGGN